MLSCVARTAMSLRAKGEEWALGGMDEAMRGMALKSCRQHHRPGHDAIWPCGARSGHYQRSLWRSGSLPMHMRKVISLLGALVIAIYSCGSAIAVEQIPVPVPPRLEGPPV